MMNWWWWCLLYRWRKCCCWSRLFSCCWTFLVTPFASTSFSSQPSTRPTCRTVFSSSFRKLFSISSTSTSLPTSSCTARPERRSDARRTGWCGVRHSGRRCARDACGDVGGRRQWLVPRTSSSSRRRLRLSSPVPVNWSESSRSSYRTTNSLYTHTHSFTCVHNNNNNNNALYAGGQIIIIILIIIYYCHATACKESRIAMNFI